MKVRDQQPRVQISPGVSMPMMGFGTCDLLGSETVFRALDWALDAGYRLIDTAQRYGNEKDIGEALKILLSKHSLKRQDVFLTTKVYWVSMGAEKTEKSFEESLKNLQTDYVDLYLVHYPRAGWLDNSDPKNRNVRFETWTELQLFLEQGRTRSIGVSNYEVRHLEEMRHFKHQPSVNQTEFHPYLTHSDVLAHCQKTAVHMQSFTTLARNDPEMHSEKILTKMAEKYDVTTAQICLAWALCQNVSVIPKSSQKGRIESNFEALKIQLTEEEIGEISGLDRHKPFSICRPWEVY